MGVFCLGRKNKRKFMFLGLSGSCSQAVSEFGVSDCKRSGFSGSLTVCKAFHDIFGIATDL